MLKNHKRNAHIFTFEEAIWKTKVFIEKQDIHDTHLLPQWGMPIDWMMKITTWQKNTKKKKKKLKELSVLKKRKKTHPLNFQT